MSFVPERTDSYCIRLVLEPNQMRMHCSPQTTGFVILIRNEVRFQLTWYQNEISYQCENFIRNENWPEWTHTEMTCTGAKFRLTSIWTDAKKYMEKELIRYGMKVIPVSCKQLRSWVRKTDCVSLLLCWYELV